MADIPVLRKLTHIVTALKENTNANPALPIGNAYALGASRGYIKALS